MSTPQVPHDGTKFAIMQALVREELTSQMIADRLGISATAVRQHLSALTAIGLVERRRQAVGAHRPVDLYRVSAAGRRVFPKRYDLLLVGLIEVLLQRVGPEATLDAVRAAARALGEQAAPALGEASGAERWKRVFAWLEREFAWESESAPDDEARFRNHETGLAGRLLVHQCPFQDVAGRHPEVCGTYFRELIRTLQGGVEIEQVRPPGEICCAFRVVAASA